MKETVFVKEIKALGNSSYILIPKANMDNIGAKQGDKIKITIELVKECK